MKKIIVALLLFSGAAYGQRTVVFHENFDLPSGADSITTGSFGSPTPALGNTSAQVAVSPTQSYKIQGSQIGTEVFFETPSFSTVGQAFVKLEFAHIAKLGLFNAAFIDYSIDNGTTWTPVTASSYHGDDGQFQSNDYFNSGSYQLAGSQPWEPANDSAMPTNSWWFHESFDLTGLVSDTSTSGPTGYANVKVRFRADFNFINAGSQFSAGWFIDDLKITASTCELDPPRLNANYQPSGCYVINPQGLMLPYPSDSVPIGIEVLKGNSLYAQAIGYASLFFSKNGGPLDSLDLPKNGGPFSTYYQAALLGIALGDTVDYFIEAYDNCGNMARQPATGFYQFIIKSFPTKCAFACGNPGVIKDFPWQENFEAPKWVAGTGTGNTGLSHRGDFPTYPLDAWTVSPNLSDGYGWSIRSGGTATTNTGPLGDHTTGQGKYIYSEFSINPNQLLSTALTTPCIDLTDSVAKIFSFYYHMFGADINRIRIDIDTGSNGSSYYNAYSRIVGQQQLSQVDPWRQHFISLAPFRGKFIQIRIGVISLGQGDETDIAIDDLEIRDAADRDISVLKSLYSFVNACSPDSNLSVSASLLNLGIDSLSIVPVAYQLDGFAVVRDTLQNAGLAFTGRTTFTFAPLLSFDGSLAHQLKIWSELPGDTAHTNDTIVLEIPARSGSVISSFPYLQNFENVTVVNGKLSIPDWTLAETGQSSYKLESYSSNDYKDGPTPGQGQQGQLLVVDAVSNSIDTVILQSTCIDLAGLTSPQLSFEYYLNPPDAVEVQARTPGGTWVPVNPVSLGSTGRSPMKLHKTDLTPYAGQIMEVRIVTGSVVNDFPFFLDNIIISENAIVDLGLTAINEEVTRYVEGTSSLDVNLDYSRTGNINPASCTLHLLFEDMCNPGTPDITAQKTFAPSTSSLSNFSVNLTNISLSSPLPAGEYELKMWLNSPGDAIAGNDSLSMHAVVSGTVAAPYFNDFEGCEILFRDNGGLDVWELTTPLGGAHSGTSAYSTRELSGFTGTHYLIPPVFEGLDTVVGAQIRFWHKPYFGSSGYGQVEYFKNGTWNPLFNGSGGTNWANKFTGTSSWIFAAYPISHAILPSGELILRIKAELANDFDGWAIDDFEIYIPPQYSASPQALHFVNGLPATGANTASLSIKNTGQILLDSTEINVVLNGNLVHTETVSLGALKAGKQAVVTLNQPLNLIAGNNDFLIYTRKPNNRMDALSTDDTLITSIPVTATVTSFPYCNDFESAAGLLPFDLASNQLDTLWKYGSTSPVKLFAAHSGSQAWFTAGSQYGPQRDNYLYTAPFDLTSGKCYRFSFYHRYDTEFNFDGGNVEYSINAGATWEILGAYQDSTWYNTPFIQSSSFVNPGFSGNSGGWVYAFQHLDSMATSQVRFRFRFTSDFANHGEGWAIDDVCLEEISCGNTSLKEQSLSAESFILYPNPADDALKLQVNGRSYSGDGKTQISVINQNGSLLRQWQQELRPGQVYSIDISRLPPGAYALKMEIESMVSFRKFVKL